MITNQNQYYRAIQDLNEIIFLTVKESTSASKFQNLDYIASLKADTEKLAAMIDQWERRSWS
jgi:hypothetical protein